jgi:hypothetical protein
LPRFDQPIEPMTLGNMRELGCGRSTGRAGTGRPATGRRSVQWPEFKIAVAYVAVQCYYFDMRWRDIAYALAMAVVAAIALTAIVDLGRHTVSLWH